MTNKEILEMTIKTEHLNFTPEYKYENYNIETDELEGFVLIKTAEEKYSEWLKNKEQIDICEPTDRERMEQIEGMVGMLAEQVARQSLGM